jgi:hypothetical protein
MSVKVAAVTLDVPLSQRERGWGRENGLATCSCFGVTVAMSVRSVNPPAGARPPARAWLQGQLASPGLNVAPLTTSVPLAVQKL